jgi:DNA-binding CsgD family transcriptional regulator
VQIEASAPTPHTEGPSPIPAEFAPYLPDALRDVNVPAYVLDREGRIRWLNPAAAKLVGDAVGHTLAEVVRMDPGRARAIFERRLARADEGDHTVDILGPDGDTTRCEISSVPLGGGHRAVGMFGLAVRRDPRREYPSDSPLTRRQHEVLLMLAEGISTRTIAETLFLSEETVRNHVRQILARLGANSRLAAVAKARRDGLV